MVIKDVKYNGPMAQLAAELMHSRTVTHQLHLSSSSYAEHKALDDYYNGIVDLIDGLVESFQGKYTVIASYPEPKIKSSGTPIGYLMSLANYVEASRGKCCESTDSYLQNQIDEILDLIYSTLYKLRFLK